MKIQIHHDDHIRATQERASRIEMTVRDALNRFGELVTDVEVHLSDENGPKFAPNDKRCLIEARLAHHRPIAVNDSAESVERAVRGASAKLERAISTVLGRSQALRKSG